MAALQSFKIDIAPDVLRDLERRLRNTRWPGPLKEDVGWDHGVNLDYLRELTDYWLNSYDWRRQEKELNKLHHYKISIGEYRLHFIHERGEGPDPVPLLLLHGWPDSFYRFHRIIPMLTQTSLHAVGPDAAGPGSENVQTFDLVIPSLPGFGFTECPKDRTHDQPIRHDAELLWTLMTRELGYERFCIAGGDGGSPLAQLMAIDHPGSVMGIYITDLGWQANSIDPGRVSKNEQHYLKEAGKEFMRQGAYAMLQSTRPQTLAYSLSDSPVGLAAWFLDRFHFWCDGDGNIERSFSRDELITNMMIYWVTGTIGSSIRSYGLDKRSPSLTSGDYVEVPTGLGLFPKEVGGVPPREFAERSVNVQHWKEMPRGGHFTAWEEPGYMAADIRDFFKNLVYESRAI
ncbi:MAG: epoxide hydrolase [Bacteroidota bacterium]|nr:epoxide hydrolase [Bacteroidota bacterium]MDP4218295.1 epoxide hydrolase [Bacteroidota bacterium]MDP4245261.1 epoxide hydrolase [Bacteroidota bacterium]MDP4254805.1 epoxide hydrolase [Bacteroidota bacterium]MDP4259426.1 epoxide hydrolase [Bacteroidota bacterium]